MKYLLAVLFYSIFLFLAVMHGVLFLFDEPQQDNITESIPYAGTLIDHLEQLYHINQFTSIDDGVETVRLYSPRYVLGGTVAGGEAVSVTIRHANKGVLATFKPRVGYDGTREQELSLAKQTLYEGSHEVVITTVALDTIIKKKYLRLEVAYDRLEIGEAVLYLDTHHIPQGYDEDFLRETDTLQGNKRTFLTYGCDADNPQLPIMMESYHQWQTVDACLSFSLPDQQLLLFEYQVWNEGEYLYTISTPEKVVRDLFSLFIHYDGIVVMNLPFWDEESQRLTSLAGWGRDLRPSLRIKSREGENITPLYDIIVDEGRSVSVETSREKIDISLYTQWDDLTSPVFPGSYYSYFLKAFNGGWRQVNAGLLTSSQPQRYTMPLGGGRGSTFGFDLTIDDTKITIFDGFQDTVFDINAIGTSIETRQRDFLQDSKDICETAELDIIQGYPYKKAVQAPGGKRLMMVGKGWHTDDLRITHNGSTKQFRPHQLEQGHLWHALDQSEFLTRGTNIYIVRVYDDRGEEICKKRIAVRY